jgi:hypothetical protein
MGSLFCALLAQRTERPPSKRTAIGSNPMQGLTSGPEHLLPFICRTGRCMPDIFKYTAQGANILVSSNHTANLTYGRRAEGS